MTADLIFDRELVRWRGQRVAQQSGRYGFLLDRVADDLAERLSFIDRPFPRVLLAGAGNAAFGRRLGDAQAARTIIAMEPGLPLATGHHGLTAVADEEALPFAANALDLVVSMLTLQFVNDLPGTLLQIRQCLKPDGLFLGAMLGGTTLQELRSAWLAAETDITGGVSPRVAPMADVRDLGSLLQRAGFALPVVDSDIVTVRYATPLALMQDVKGMGASNPLVARRRVPVTRRLLLRAADIYAERFAEADGRVPATFEILTLTAWAPHDSQQKPLRPGSAKTRLADALGTSEHVLPVGAGGPRPPKAD